MVITSVSGTRGGTARKEIKCIAAQISAHLALGLGSL
jgi:hypothetical protein